jgi:hypothetical protein
LRTVWFIFALIADLCQSSLRVDGDRAKIAGFNAPGTAVTLGGIDINDTGHGVLGEGITRADDHAGGVFAGAAGDSGDEDFIHAYSADAAAIGVIFSSFCERTDVLTKLTAYAKIWIAIDISIF